MSGEKSWTLKALAFDEYCRFDSSIFVFWGKMRAFV
jgi:hypothetical protein